MSTLETNIAQVNSDLQAIKTAIVDSGVEVADGTSTSEYADKVGEVYEAGEQAGRQAEYDAFWDAYQQNGERTDYAYAFAGIGWTNDTFAPKYGIKPIGHGSAFNVFSRCCVSDLRPAAVGVNIDFSSVTNANYLLSELTTTEYVGVVDLRNARYCAYFCYSATSLKSIERLILPVETALATFGNTGFYACTSLEHIVIDGTLYHSTSFCWSPLLTYESILSIINALSDTTSDQTVTLSLTAVNNAFETSEGAADGSTSDEWLGLVETKSNWTISLA